MSGFRLSIISPFLFDVKLSVTVLVVFVVICITRYYRSPWRKLPPGPIGLPLLGNIFPLKEKRIWLTFTKWSQVYGPIMHVNVLGQPIIVLNTHKAAADLLERRSAIYADRPPNIVGVEMMTGGHFFALAGATDVWKRMRKAAREALNKGVINKDHHLVLFKEAVALTSGLLADSTSWNKHIRRATASAMVAMIYDKEPLESTKDPAIVWLHDFFLRILRAVRPGAHLVEFFTWMKHIPACLATWKSEALQHYQNDMKVLRGLFDSVKHQIAEGSERPSLTATLIWDQEKNRLSEIENIWVAGTIYFAGDAPAEVLEWWMVAMIVYPETQKKAQQELDKVVGSDRLPSFNDFENLPYIRAMVKEILRWALTAPIGAPHRSTRDDWYNGYFIPKNSIMIANMWRMNRDLDIYGHNAHHFDPARYLDDDDQMVPAPPDTKEEGHVTFGYGRRTCLGRQVANDSLFINIAIMLWAMNIEYALDTEGKPFRLDVTECVEDGLAIRPIPFQCKISPRFPNAMSVLENAKENFM